MELFKTFFADFSIVNITGIEIKLHGLGPLNWVGRLMVVKKTRQEMMKVVGQQSLVDQLYIHVLKRELSRK